jgi:hypothetical protein
MNNIEQLKKYDYCYQKGYIKGYETCVKDLIKATNIVVKKRFKTKRRKL